jgi:hypothetical protein
VAPPAGRAWTLAFDVGFDGTSLDTTKLTPSFDWNYGGCTSSFNTGKEHYLPSQVQVNNGVAHLAAEPLNPPYINKGCYSGVCTYRSGRLSTARPNQSHLPLFVHLRLRRIPAEAPDHSRHVLRRSGCYRP